MPRPLYLPTESWERAQASAFEDQRDDALADLDFQSALPRALKGLQQIKDSWKPLPIVVSPASGTQSLASPVVMPQQSAVSTDANGTPLTPDTPETPQTPGSYPPFKAEDFMGPAATPSGTPSAMPTGGDPATPAAAAMAAPRVAPTSSGADHGPIDNTSRQSFIKTAFPYMLEAAGGNRDAAEMMLATAISENGSVGSGRPIWANNMFGIKGTGDAGSENAATWEQTASGPVNINDNFAAYSTPVVGSRAFFDFLQNNSRYAGALQKYNQTGDAVQLFRDVNAAGYATDPDWAGKVQNIRDNQVAPLVRDTAPNAAAGLAPVAAAPPSAAAGSPPPPAAALDMARSGQDGMQASALSMKQPWEDEEQPYDPRDADSGAHEIAPPPAFAGAVDSESEGGPRVTPTYGPSVSEAGPEVPDAEPQADPEPVSPVQQASNWVKDKLIPVRNAAGDIVEYVQREADAAVSAVQQNMDQNRRNVEQANAQLGYGQITSTPGEPDHVGKPASAFDEVDDGVRSIASVLEPAGGGGRMTARVNAINDQAAKDQGRTDIRSGIDAATDPTWRAENPTLAAEYDELQNQLGMNAMGQAGDTPRVVGRAGQTLIEAAAPVVRRAGEAVAEGARGVGRYAAGEMMDMAPGMPRVAEGGPGIGRAMADTGPGPSRSSVPNNAAERGMDTLYHETDPRTAFMMLNEISGSAMQDLHVTPNPDFALGQGARGAVIELGNTDGIGVIRNSAKPGLRMMDAAGQGSPEWIVQHAADTPDTYIRAITVKPDARMDRVSRSIARQVEEDGWTIENLPDGSRRFVAPENAPTRPEWTPGSAPAAANVPVNSTDRVYRVLDQDGDEIMSFGNRAAAEDMVTKAQNREPWQMPLSRVPSTVDEIAVPAVASSTSANATAGALPASQSTDRLGAVNRVLSQGVASAVSGGVGAQVNQQMNPDDPNAGIKGFAAGAVGPFAAARAVRAGLKAAGKAEGREAGALATFGASPNGAPRRRLRAQVLGQRAITATPAEEVSRLRLDRFPPEVRGDIEAAAKETGFARDQRRGVLPDAVVQQMADADTKSVDDLIKKGKAGKSYNPEETVAVRNAVASQANVVRELSEQIAEARTAGHAPELLIARRANESTKLAGLIQVAEGARAEAGRTLRQYAQQAKVIELNPDEAVERIYRKLGGRDNAGAAVDEYTKMVQDGADPIKLSKFWAKVESGTITKSDLFALYRRFNMLSGPRTFEVNALSGGVNLSYEVLASAGVQALRGRGGEAVAELAAPFKAGARAFQNMAETMWHGVSLEQATRGDIPRNLSARTDNKAAKGALTALEVPDRLNAGVDQFFRTLTEDWAATRLAQKQARDFGMSPRSAGWNEKVAANLEAIREDVSKFPEIQATADRVTFSEEPAGLVKTLEKAKRDHPNIVGFLAPFIRTPANIASRAVDLSPIGPLRTAVESRANIGRGRANLSPRIRDNMVGTAATIWAYDQAQQGNITGAGPDDTEKRAMLGPQWQPYSIKVGDRYWSYANFAPFSLALSMGAAASEAQKYAKPGESDTLSLLSDGAKRTGKVVTDMTVLAGIGAVVKSIQDPDRYGTQWLTQALQQLMPAGSFVNTVGQAADTKVRRADRTDVGTQISQNLQARVPGLRENVPVAQDPLGRDIPNEQSGFWALSPVRPKTVQEDPAMQPFIDAGVDIGKPKDTLTVRAGTPPIALNPTEQRRWNQLRGEQIQRFAPQISHAESYRAAGKQGQEIFLKRLLSQATEAADRLILSEMGNAEIRRRMTESLQKKAS